MTLKHTSSQMYERDHIAVKRAYKRTSKRKTTVIAEVVKRQRITATAKALDNVDLGYEKKTYECVL